MKRMIILSLALLLCLPLLSFADIGAPKAASTSIAASAPEGTSTTGAEVRKHTFEVGTEISYIKYEEPSVMEQKGMMYGLVADYTYRGWLAPAPRDLDKFMFSLETKNSWGSVDYSSPISGTLDDIPDYMLEIRALLGYDFNVVNSSILTPYFGVGYRYLNDDSGSMIASGGGSGYERQANYFYVPIGAKFNANLNKSWSIGARAEYDIFCLGRQYSHLEDVFWGFNTLENKQGKGYGVRGSIKIAKKGERLNLVIEPFVRYWNIKQSKDAIITLFGVPWGIGWEPKNNSLECGGRFALEF